MRTRQGRAKQHPFGHVALPKRHGLAENAEIQSVGRPQVGCGGEPIRAGANDRYVTGNHWPFPAEAQSFAAGAWQKFTAELLFSFLGTYRKSPLYD